MSTPNSQFHSHPLLRPWLPVIQLVILAAAAEQQQGCRDKCGHISIPFPFGIGRGCFRHGFEVVCNDSSYPPRAFLAGKRISRLSSSPLDPENGSDWSFSSIELVSISVATGKARVYAPVSYLCSTNLNRTFSAIYNIHLAHTPFAVSATRNILVGVGWRVDAFVTFIDFPLRWPYTVMFACSARARNLLPSVTPTNGSCTGRGCCHTTIPPDNNLGNLLSFSVKGEVPNERWEDYPCSYAMLVDKSWYNFSTPDMEGNRTLLKRFPRGVHIALDFAAGNTSCPAKGQPPPPDYACISGNSSCANSTHTPGYICKCWDHYAGNPYITHGCQDIDECKLPHVYPCSNGGICKNRLGGYDCPCKFGMKGDGKAGTCSDIFTPAAKAAVGAIGGILLMAVLSFLLILHKEKKKTEEFYKKNGGPTLEKADVIKLFKKGELKPILRSSNLIGKGYFGEVYKGLLDNKLVAIKKPINGSVLESEQFANEVIIQSRVIHKNIVRLIGCCLEVDAPMLVYEFISQGSLLDILHNSNNKVALNLDTRLSIAAQSADGLAYMHSKKNSTILHGDVKPANILLDDNFVPKISDFGISKLIQRDKQHTGQVIGDMNYMDPVYLQEGRLTEKSDVYSFGIVILELISRRRAIHSENNSLVKGFLEAHKKQKKTTEFYDKEIAITKDLELLDSLADIVVECLSLDVDQRPTMMEVAEQLLVLGRSRKA
uniref:SnTox1 sensitivity protein n=1 Tax=Triticum aestivum TaxID=4565 RepID=A0A7M1I6H4_WHEAT|nr:SnTox1 sensitivity protein [Triticum aestivum]